VIAEYFPRSDRDQMLIEASPTSAERDISGERKLQLLNVFWRLSSYFAVCSCLSLAVFRGLQLACVSPFYHVGPTKNTYSRPTGHENPLLGPAATRIQIQVIAIQKFLYAVFTLQIMVRNVYDETPRYSAEVTFTL